MFRKILLAINSSDQADGAVLYASQLAKGFAIPVVLLQVGGPEKGFREAGSILSAAARLSADRVSVESLTATGNPADDILGSAAQRGCELIVTSPQIGVGEGKGLGNIAAEVLRRVQVPLLLVPHGYSHGATKMIVSLDGSTLAEVALPYAEEIARRLSVPICLARAYQPWLLPITGIEGYAYVGTSDIEAAENDATEYLRGVASRLDSAGQPVVCQAFPGTAAEAIMGFAGRNPGGVIILTTHGRSGLARWVLGSVTEEMASFTSNPILIIPHKFGVKYARGITELLQQTPLFSGVRETELNELAQVARVRKFASGDEVVREGDQGSEFFIISSGHVHVIKAGEPEETQVAILGPGDFFGELSLLDHEPRSATVKAVGDVECVSINRTDFSEQLNKHPQIAAMMLPALARRLRRAMARSVD